MRSFAARDAVQDDKIEDGPPQKVGPTRGRALTKDLSSHTHSESPHLLKEHFSRKGEHRLKSLRKKSNEESSGAKVCVRTNKDALSG